MNSTSASGYPARGAPSPAEIVRASGRSQERRIDDRRMRPDWTTPSGRHIPGHLASGVSSRVTCCIGDSSVAADIIRSKFTGVITDLRCPLRR